MMMILHPRPPDPKPLPDPMFFRGVRNALLITLVLLVLVAAIWWL